MPRFHHGHPDKLILLMTEIAEFKVLSSLDPMALTYQGELQVNSGYLGAYPQP